MCAVYGGGWPFLPRSNASSSTFDSHLGGMFALQSVKLKVDSKRNVEPPVCRSAEKKSNGYAMSFFSPRLAASASISIVASMGA